MNCNEKELKAKLYNNRAIAHFKLGKMMRALIYIFLSSARAFSSFSENVIVLNIYLKIKNPKKYICLILASQTYKEQFTSFSLSYCIGGGNR